MASRTLPGLALKAFWLLGEDNYKDELDANLLKLSALVDGGAISKVSALPGSPTDGDIHILDETVGGGNANKVAVRDNGAWVYYTPNEGWLLFDRTNNKFVYFNGTEWGDFIGGVPDFDPVEDAGKYLMVKLDGSGLQWATFVGGGTGGTEGWPTAAAWRVIADAAGSDGTNVGMGEIQFRDRYGDTIFESGTLNRSSAKSGFGEIKGFDGNYDPGNGWMADIPTTEDAIGAWWSITYAVPREVAGLMIYPIQGDPESCPTAFRAQYYDDALADWVDAGTFTGVTWTESQQFFALDTIPIEGGELTGNELVLGRKTAGPGPVEELTLSEILDFIGSAAHGDILYRGATDWARLPAGTADRFLRTNGAGANPSWATPTAAGGATARPWYFNPPLAANLTLASNSGTSTATDDDDVGLMFAMPSPAGVNLRHFWYETLASPGGDWQLTVRITGLLHSGGTAVSNGICAYESATNKYISSERTNGDNLQVTAATAGLNGARTAITAAGFSGADANIVWFRLARVGANLVTSRSHDGKQWSVALTEALTTRFTTQPDRVGIFLLQDRTTGIATNHTCDFYELI